MENFRRAAATLERRPENRLLTDNRLSCMKPASQGLSMITERQEDVTPAVLDVMQRTGDPRLREIMVSLVAHLHTFIREVRMTEKEFHDAAAILNELGQRSNDSHNETV